MGFPFLNNADVGYMLDSQLYILRMRVTVSAILLCEFVFNPV